jgi:hypothetical protein
LRSCLPDRGCHSRLARQILQDGRLSPPQQRDGLAATTASPSVTFVPPLFDRSGDCLRCRGLADPLCRACRAFAPGLVLDLAPDLARDSRWEASVRPNGAAVAAVHGRRRFAASGWVFGGPSRAPAACWRDWSGNGVTVYLAALLSELPAGLRVASTDSASAAA